MSRSAHGMMALKERMLPPLVGWRIVVRHGANISPSITSFAGLAASFTKNVSSSKHSELNHLSKCSLLREPPTSQMLVDVTSFLDTPSKCLVTI